MKKRARKVDSLKELHTANQNVIGLAAQIGVLVVAEFLSNSGMPLDPSTREKLERRAVRAARTTRSV